MLRIMLVGLMMASSSGLIAAKAVAEEITLRLHQPLPSFASLPTNVLKPWGAAIEARSGGELVIEHFDAMSLGGAPNLLMDQAIDGVADIVMTVASYTPGRFPGTEVIELPFMMTDPVATSLALQQLIDDELQATEYNGVKVLGAWVHGPGVIHAKDGIASLEDMRGKKIRVPTRSISRLLVELGATPIGLPIPAVPEALSKGVIDGTVIPWEVSTSIRLHELASHHTEFSGSEALYTAAILLVMNKTKYDSLPEHLRDALDAESGAKLSEFAAREARKADLPARQRAEDAGNSIIELDEKEVARWKQAAAPVIDAWIAEMDSKGLDGKGLMTRAKALIAEETQQN